MQKVDINEVTEDRRPILVSQADSLRHWITVLEPEERILLDLYVNHDVSVHQMAALSGRNPQNVGKLISRLMRELVFGMYPKLYRKRRELSGVELRVGYDLYLLGLSGRMVASKRQISQKEVGRIARKLKAVAGEEEKS